MLDHHGPDAPKLKWCVGMSTRCSFSGPAASGTGALDLHLCGMRELATCALARKISVRGRETRNPDPPARHSLEDPSSDPTLIFNLCYGVQDNLSCSKQKREGQNLPDHVPECTSKQSLNTTGIFFTSPAVV